jgi:hypothetical protein
VDVLSVCRVFLFPLLSTIKILLSMAIFKLLLEIFHVELRTSSSLLNMDSNIVPI